MARRNSSSAACQSHSYQNFTRPSEACGSLKDGSISIARVAAAAARGPASLGESAPNQQSIPQQSATPDREREHLVSMRSADSNEARALRTLSSDRWPK